MNTGTIIALLTLLISAGLGAYVALNMSKKKK